MRAHYSKGMSRKAFDARLQELLDTYARRIERIQMIKSGELQAKRVWVKPFIIKQHRVQGHYRYITKPILSTIDLGTAQGTKKGM